MNKKFISEFQEILQKNSNDKTRLWWENYLKNEIKFRGVGIPDIRSLLRDWYAKNRINTCSLDQQFDLALQFFKEPYTEDKLTGVLILQLFLIDKIDYNTALTQFVSLYQEGYIFEWNTCDWFCVCVLGPMIDLYGTPCAEKIAAWCNAANVWQARSSIVPFVYLKDKSAYLDLIQKTNKVLIRRQERFAKTAVGWILRELYKSHSDFVFTFINSNLSYFSVESLSNTLKYAPEKTQYVDQLKSL